MSSQFSFPVVKKSSTDTLTSPVSNEYYIASSETVGDTYDVFNTSALVPDLITHHFLPENNNVRSPQDEGALISYSTMHAIETSLQVALVPFLVLCGVTLNVINMAVFAHQGLADRVNLCLFSLAVSDSGYLGFLMASRSFSLLHLASDTLGEYWKFKGFILIGVFAGFLNTSNCLTLLISLERCFCVVWPLKARTILSDRAVRWLIVLAFVGCLSVNAPFCFKFDVQSYREPTSNTTRFRFVGTQFYEENGNVIDFLYENINIYLPTVSLVVVTAATVIIAVRMRTVMAWRQAVVATTAPPQYKDSREASVTRMLVVVCAIYIVCSLPYVTHMLFMLMVHLFFPASARDFQPDGMYRNIMHVTVVVMHTFLCFNSSTNFLIYYFMSTRYRESFEVLVCKRRFLAGQRRNEGRALAASSVSTRCTRVD